MGRETKQSLEQEKKAAEEAIKAQREAERQALERAESEAKAQAEIAAAQRKAALESKAAAARLELLKTETLQKQLAHEQEIAAIVQDILRIRLAGEEDRARIINEYLTRIEREAAQFDEERGEIEARINQYLDFNAKLLTSLAEYRVSVEQTTVEVNNRIAEQQVAIERLEQQIKELTEDEQSGSQ